MLIDIQLNADDTGIPTSEQLQQWAEAALEYADDDTEVTIRIVELDESRALNSQYRGKDNATNVLSFPFENPPGVTLPLLGDLVICAPVVQAEAIQQHKAVEAHWAHMVVHGMLHLQGYDHILDSEAEDMEQKEVSCLNGLGYPDPYRENATI